MKRFDICETFNALTSSCISTTIFNNNELHINDLYQLSMISETSTTNDQITRILAFDERLTL